MLYEVITIEIVYQVFDMENVMYTKVSMGQEDFDLVCPTQSIMQRIRITSYNVCYTKLLRSDAADTSPKP